MAVRVVGHGDGWYPICVWGRPEREIKPRPHVCQKVGACRGRPHPTDEHRRSGPGSGPRRARVHPGSARSGRLVEGGLRRGTGHHRPGHAGPALHRQARPAGRARDRPLAARRSGWARAAAFDGYPGAGRGDLGASAVVWARAARLRLSDRPPRGGRRPRASSEATAARRRCSSASARRPRRAVPGDGRAFSRPSGCRRRRRPSPCRAPIARHREPPERHHPLHPDRGRRAGEVPAHGHAPPGRRAGASRGVLAELSAPALGDLPAILEARRVRWPLRSLPQPGRQLAVRRHATTPRWCWRRCSRWACPTTTRSVRDGLAFLAGKQLREPRRRRAGAAAVTHLRDRRLADRLLAARAAGRPGAAGEPAAVSRAVDWLCGCQRDGGWAFQQAQHRHARLRRRRRGDGDAGHRAGRREAAGRPRPAARARRSRRRDVAVRPPERRRRLGLVPDRAARQAARARS